MKPVWYLDVDDVINFTNPRGVPKAWSRQRPYTRIDVARVADARGRVFTITWAAPVTALIRRMSELVDVVWMTSWNEGNIASTTLGDALGLPDLPNGYTLAGLDAPSGPNLPVKWAAVKTLSETMFAGCPTVWTDDELGGRLRSDAKYLFGARGVPLKTVTPNRDVGLTPTDLENIERFIRGHLVPTG